MPPVIGPILVVTLCMLTTATPSLVEGGASEENAEDNPNGTSGAPALEGLDDDDHSDTNKQLSDTAQSVPEETTVRLDLPTTTQHSPEAAEKLHEATGVTDDTEVRGVTVSSTQPDEYTDTDETNEVDDVTREGVVQSVHSDSGELKVTDSLEGTSPATEGAVSNDVDEDLRNLDLIHATTSADDSHTTNAELDTEGSGTEEANFTETSPPPKVSKEPNSKIPQLATGCTQSLCQDILRANITAEPSYVKVAGGNHVQFTCAQKSDFNQTGRWFILRWQGPNGTLGSLQEKHDGQRGRASVLSGQALGDFSELNYTCVPEVPISCCDDVGVTVTLHVYDPPVYTTHIAVLGGLMLSLAVLGLILHETRRRTYKSVKTTDDVDEEWEYEVP